MEVQCQLMAQETVSSETEEMMELFDSIEEGLPHYLQQWASTAVKFLMQTALPINCVYISVSSIILLYYHQEIIIGRERESILLCILLCNALRIIKPVYPCKR